MLRLEDVHTRLIIMSRVIFKFAIQVFWRFLTNQHILLCLRL